MALLSKHNSHLIQGTTQIASNAYSQVVDCDEEVFSLYCNLTSLSAKKYETDQKLGSLELELTAYKEVGEEAKVAPVKVILEKANNGKNSNVKYKAMKTQELLQVYVTITQNQSTLNNLGVTGTVAWNSSYYLAQWILSHPEWFLDKKCLELGSGTGVVGIALGKMMAKLKSTNGSIILTDQEANLPLLNKNILINFPIAIQASKNKKLTHIDITCAELSWEDVPKLVANPNGTWLDSHDDGWDVIILSDCVYNEHLVLPLINCLQSLARMHPLENPTIIILCQELRSDLVHAAFLIQLLKAGFKVVRANSINPVEDIKHVVLYVMWLEAED